MTTPRHLVAIWNPSYAADALDEHLRILLAWSARSSAGDAQPEDVYVWWARLRSPNRLGPLPHISDVLALKRQLESEVETHIYLTDFQSLYVGKLGDLEEGDLLQDFPDEVDHLPEYSRERPTDLFFQLWDIRRLIADDTVGVVDELKKLLNVRYDRRPVSIYGGMTDLPLIVERPDARLWFGDDGSLTDGRLWAEHDAELRSETDRMSRELREDLFGDDVWGTLEPGTRSFLSSGEAIFRARRHDPAFDFAAPAIAYAKALETELNAIVFATLRRVYSRGNPIGRQSNIDSRPVDLGEAVPHQTLGSLINILENNEDVRRGVKIAFSDHDARQLLAELPSYLKPIAELRNPAAHSLKLDRAEAARVREWVMGIGQEGLIARLARVKLRARTEDRVDHQRAASPHQ